MTDEQITAALGLMPRTRFRIRDSTIIPASQRSGDIKQHPQRVGLRTMIGSRNPVQSDPAKAFFTNNGSVFSRKTNLSVRAGDLNGHNVTSAKKKRVLEGILTPGHHRGEGAALQSAFSKIHG